MADDDMIVPQDKAMTDLRLSVSPPRDRHVSPSTWRSSTPPPPQFLRPVAVASPTTSDTGTGMPRTLSSPSLMDSSPKPKSTTPLSFSRKANELTPITRNTSTKSDYIDDDHVVSPDDTDALHGEHLALPSDLHDRKAPSMPQFISERCKSVGSILEHRGMVEHAEEEEDQDRLVPLKFPSDRQYYSFTSQKQFVATTSFQTGLKPYQPTRETVGTFTGEELERIYRQPDPIPVERQWSIPSIHLANHLNGSTTSYTDEEDELGRDDDASLSSRGSSLYLPADDGEEIAKQILPLSVARYDDSDDNDADQEDEKPRKRKNEKESPFDWLRSVESDEGISEAASSKFLTGNMRVPQDRRRSYHRHTQLEEGTL